MLTSFRYEKSGAQAKLPMNPQMRSMVAVHQLETLIEKKMLWGMGPHRPFETLSSGRGLPTQILHQSPFQMCGTGLPRSFDATPRSRSARRSGYTFLALMPCGLKAIFTNAMASFMTGLHPSKLRSLRYAIENNVNHELMFYPKIRHLDHLEELPDVIISSDFNPFFHRRFYRRFVQPGNFIDVMKYTPNRSFAQCGIIDPERQHTILGVNPQIIVADLKRVGNRTLPRRWEDLLDPKWHRSITLCANEFFFCHTLSLSLYKEHGLAAIRALARNIRGGTHPSQMVKAVGGGGSAALYVIPEFFAQKIPSRKLVRFIWPEDGAVASPVSLLVKKRRADRLTALTDFLISKELAQIFHRSHFPSPHPCLGKCASADAPGVKWLGWGFIYDNDIGQITSQINKIFSQVRDHSGRTHP